jgi:hypothetical protein
MTEFSEYYDSPRNPRHMSIPMAKVTIGLRQAKRLCQLTEKERFSLIAEGLPIILESARGFWRASGQLADNNPREADVLESFAEEEAAKILILMDVVRCPSKRIAERIGHIIDNFYDHLARLLYAEAQGWQPMHVIQLQKYLDSEREAHYLEGYIGEYIVPNWTIYARESQLYADIEASEEGAHWNKPTSYRSGLPRFTPTALRVAEALSAFGIFTPQGLDATAEVWGQLEFRDSQTRADAEQLTEQLLKKLTAEGSTPATAQQDVNALYRSWQMPMYHLDFKLLPVPLEKLIAQRVQIFWQKWDTID